MNFDLSDEQQMLVDNARRFVREHCGLEARLAAIASETGFSRQRWAELGRLGWLALPLTEAAGGFGGGDVDVALLAEELGRGLVPEPFIDTAVLCATLLEQAPSSRLRDHLLARTASGEIILALAHMEPGDRSEFETDPATRAQPHADGWRLQGSKHFVVHGGAADYWLVSATIEDQHGFALFLLSRDQASAAEIHEYTLIDGSRALDVHLHGIAVPSSALLLEPGVAAQALEKALHRAIIASTASVIGSMEAVMEATAVHLKTREQYGQPLAKFQALQHRMAEMLVETDKARSGLFSALASLETDDPRSRRRAISGAKSLASRAALFVTTQGIQLHGAIGVTEEFSVGHHYKSALIYEKRFGDAEFHLARWAAAGGFDRASSARSAEIRASG